MPERNIPAVENGDLLSATLFVNRQRRVHTVLYAPMFYSQSLISKPTNEYEMMLIHLQNYCYQLSLYLITDTKTISTRATKDTIRASFFFIIIHTFLNSFMKQHFIIQQIYHSKQFLPIFVFFVPRF